MNFWTLWELDDNGYWKRMVTFSSRREAEDAAHSVFIGRTMQLRDPDDKVRWEKIVK